MSGRVERRDFLKFLATASAGALAACSSEPARKLIPYVVPPEEIVPGVSTWYKSTCRECPAGCGVLVRTREGRALKLEGNPDHPVNSGALCVRGQAAVQGLYNPDRIRQPLKRNERGQLVPITWEEGERLLADTLRYLRYEKQADRVALVSHRVTGSLDKLFREWMAAYGSRRYLQYEPFAYEALREANRRSFGTSEIPRYDIAAARFLLNFGADFLETWVSNVAFTRAFADFRSDLSRRFVHVEARQSLTAANADEWLTVRPGSEGVLVLGLVREVLQAGLARSASLDEARALRASSERYDPDTVARVTGVPADRLRLLAREFAQAQPGLALGGGVASGDENAVATQMGVNALNYICGNVGQTVHFGQGTGYDGVATYRDTLNLVKAMKGEDILAALFHHANPLFTLPTAAGFGEALRKVPFKVSFASYLDETTSACDLVLPDHTPLERWEDYQPRAGVYGLSQPTMQPIFDTRATPDVLLALGRQVAPELARSFPSENFLDYLRSEWRALHRRFAPQQDFETFWRQAVESGGVWSAVPESSVRFSAQLSSLPEVSIKAGNNAKDLALVVYPSQQLFDGRGANRPWLQEVPEAMSKIVWNNWIEIHPEAAGRLGIGESDLLRLTSEYGSCELPAHLTEGIHPEAVAVPLGQGHTAYGRYAEGKGANPVAALPPQAQPGTGARIWSGVRVRIEKLAINRPLVKTQHEDRQHGRGFAQVVPLAELTHPKEKHEEHKLPKIYPPHEHKEHRWGLVIDHNNCVGCNACIAACYAENNIPIVGPEQVDRGRHMAWIRVERYYEAAGEYPEARFLVMLCQHCDQAPCESVCPVYATYHNPEGLNVQVYNRCVGTRYCSNNCPYKVRRFNFQDHQWPSPLDLQLNPDVSVRSKGIMEKCTFCVQRIREGKDRAKDENRKVRDGEITPACVQTCPANAITFGDLKDPESRVAKLAKDPRHYRVLEDLNTEPAVTYLKRVARPPARA
jgi:molybdopterin-containing oxidoreductase family iron-sulfur binding subunit